MNHVGFIEGEKFVVIDEKDLAPATELIRMSHRSFADKNGALQKAINEDNGQPIQEKQPISRKVRRGAGSGSESGYCLCGRLCIRHFHKLNIVVAFQRHF
jgi:hypothetical protein